MLTTESNRQQNHTTTYVPLTVLIGTDRLSPISPIKPPYFHSIHLYASSSTPVFFPPQLSSIHFTSFLRVILDTFIWFIIYFLSFLYYIFRSIYRYRYQYLYYYYYYYYFWIYFAHFPKRSSVAPRKHERVLLVSICEFKRLAPSIYFDEKGERKNRFLFFSKKS